MVLRADATGRTNGVHQLPDTVPDLRNHFLWSWFWLLWKPQRYEVYLVVGAIWVLQIIWSHVWLRYFRFGPLEWCWRSLTYWKKQPMRKENTKEVLSI